MYRGEKKCYKIIGICMARIQTDYVRSIVMSISKEAHKRGFRVFLFNAFNDMYYDTMFTRGESSIFKLVNPELLDALVVLPESIKRDDVWQSIVSDAQKAGLPVICVDREVDCCPSIVFNYADTFEKIVRHVIEDHGCRRVNLIAGIKDNPFSEERVDCFKKVLRENGIEFEEARLGYGDFWDIPTRKVLEDFFASGMSMPEAIICCNDTMAIETCRTLKEHGYKVPEDILVTGFDGIELEKYVSPRLTTAAANIDALGVKTVDLLEKLIAGEATDNTVDIPFKMRLSQSCGCEKISADFSGEKIMELYNRIHNSEGHEEHMFSYTFHSVDCLNFDDMAKIMFNYADYFTWCCLNSDVINDIREENRYHDIFSENMITIMRREKDEMQTNLVFPAKQMLPDIDYALEHHNIIMFVPIHFQEEIMGYAAVAINTDDFNFVNTHRFINNTNQIFENLKNRIRLQRAYAEMAEMHVRDALTGIYNRRGFYKKTAELAEKYGDTKEYVLFSADLDRLKVINDTYGHDMGDKAIKAAADVLYEAGGLESVCARFGGDEFVLIAPTDNGEEFIEKFNAELQALIDSVNNNGAAPYKLGISCGAAILDYAATKQLDRSIKLADTHMYECKRRRHSVGQ